MPEMKLSSEISTKIVKEIRLLLLLINGICKVLRLIGEEPQVLKTKKNMFLQSLTWILIYSKKNPSLTNFWGNTQAKSQNQNQLQLRIGYQPITNKTTNTKEQDTLIIIATKTSIPQEQNQRNTIITDVEFFINNKKIIAYRISFSYNWIFHMSIFLFDKWHMKPSIKINININIL